MIYRNKLHDNLITFMVKLRPFMYLKKCEKTFEILRSEITFLMDLYFLPLWPRYATIIKEGHKRIISTRVRFICNLRGASAHTHNN